MPGRDETGPEGEGPMTGRQMGDCASNGVPDGLTPGRGYAGRPFVRRGLGGRPYVGRRAGGRRGAGRRGWRRRNWFYATGVPGRARFGPDAPSADAPSMNETESLETKAEWLRGELDAIDQRLQELDQQE